MPSRRERACLTKFLKIPPLPDSITDGTLVTALDHDINNRFFKTVIAGEFRDDPVISEETKNIFDPNKSGYWVIDPLDGTFERPCALRRLDRFCP